MASKKQRSSTTQPVEYNPKMHRVHDEMHAGKTCTCQTDRLGTIRDPKCPVHSVPSSTPAHSTPAKEPLYHDIHASTITRTDVRNFDADDADTVDALYRALRILYIAAGGDTAIGGGGHQMESKMKLARDALRKDRGHSE